LIVFFWVKLPFDIYFSFFGRLKQEALILDSEIRDLLVSNPRGKLKEKAPGIFCSSRAIERDLLASVGVDEIEDSVLVSSAACSHCQVNCSRSPHYNSEAMLEMPLPRRYKKPFF
jgi:hypothetical protein